MNRDRTRSNAGGEGESGTSDSDFHVYAENCGGT